MITGTLKSQIDAIWNDFWTGGISNPLTVIEQFTYLIFLKQLDDRQILIEKEISLLGSTHKTPVYTDQQKELRWSYFKEKDPEAMFELFTRPQKHIEDLTAFDFMRTLGDKGGKFSQYMKGATFMINTPKLLDKVVQQIDKLPLDNRDTKGDLYEYMLSKIAEAGTNGQFRTPRHIIRMMVHLTQPQKEDTILDPAMGTAGFLVEASRYIHENHEDWFLDADFRKHYENEMFNGIEIDASMMRIASMNLMLHGLETPNLTDGSALAESNSVSDEYSLVLANPPFKGALDYDEVESSLLTMTKTKKTELLFVALMLRMLKIGGRAAVIVPDGVLFGSSRAHKNLRKELVENQQLQGVISMPSGVFKPYAGVSTAVLLFTKTNRAETDKVWFFDMKADGFSLDDKRTPLIDEELLEKCFTNPEAALKETDENCDIAAILSQWNNGELDQVKDDRTAQSFMVPKEDIIANDYDLSINRYKEIIYEKIEYEKPGTLLKQIRELDMKRQKAGDGLELNEGKYPFYTSSENLSKSIDVSQFEGDSLIFGTGGKASIHFESQKFSVSTDCFVVHPKEKVYTKFVYHYLSGNIHVLEEGFRGAGLKHISKGYIQDLEIPLPSLAIQKSIAAQLDKADELIEYNRHLLEKYDELQQSLFLDMFGDPMVNEKGWEVKKLGKLGNWQSGGTPLRSVSEYFEGTIPWLSSGELNDIYISDSIEHITEIAIKESAAKLIPINSILLGMYDTAALKSSINLVEITCNQAIAFSKLNDKLVNTLFVYFVIQYGKEYYRRQQRGVRQKNMNLTMIRNLEIMFPPLSLQNEFASHIASIEYQKTLVKDALAKSEDIFNGLLQEHFSG